MKKRLFVMLICAAFVLPNQVRAGDALKDTLSAIPGDAMGFIAVPNLKNLDADYQKAVASLGLQAFVPPPMSSLVGVLKQRAPQLEKMDDDGAVIVVFMPAESLPELQTKQAVILPAKDPKALLEGMNGQAGEEGLWTVNLFGMPMYAIAGEKRVIVSMMPDVVKSIKDSKSDAGSQLNKNVVASLDGLDLIVWVDGQKLVKVIRPLVEGMLAMMQAQSANAGELQSKYNDYQAKNIKLALDGIGSITVGLALSDAGLDLRSCWTTVAGSELAKRTRLKTTSESLLAGLPETDYAVALGEVIDSSAIKEASTDLESLLPALGEVEGLDKEKVKKVKDLIVDMATSMSGARGVLEFLAPGPGGMLGLSLVIETADAEKWIGMLGDVTEMGKQIGTSVAKAQAAKAGEDEKQVDELFASFSFTKDAGTVAGAKASTFKVDVDKLAKMKEADEDDMEDVKKLIGDEGLVFRLAAADAKNVVISFGGGESRMSKFVAAAKEGGSALAKTQGIEKISKQLPSERASVIYVAVDRIIAGIKSIQEHMDEEALPIQMPPLHAPVAMAATGGDGWGRYDIFLPTELLVAGKNAAMGMMMGGAQGQEEPADQPQ